MARAVTVNGALTISGGSLAIGSSLSNSGTITLGKSTAITVGNSSTFTGGTFSQASSGVLDTQLGGAPSTGKYGKLNVYGGATLAGTLKADVLSGYAPSTTDAFTTVGFNSKTGNFATYLAQRLEGLSVRQADK